MPLDCKLKDFEFQPPDTKKSAGIFKELEFHKFSRELMPVKKISYDNYQLITTRPGLRKLVDRLKKSKAFAVDLETTGLDPMSDKIVGLSFSIQDHESFYIPVAHDYDGVPAQLDRQWVLNELKGVLEDERITKVGQNIKFDLVLLARAGVDLAGFLEDIMLVSYILNPVKRNHNLEDISRAYLGHQMISYQEVVGTGRKKISFAQVELEPAKVYSAEDADVTFLCHKILRARLTKKKLVALFEEIESPLIRVLADMEMAGVKVDKSFLKKLSVEFSRRLKILEKKIYELGGSEFNIDSPKQLQVVLFEKLKLPARKRTKTGYSTNSDVLTDLAREHELPALILEYRGLAKLKNTYSDNFFELINPETGRVHTSYNQAVTATGRLSSREPNLQNIPIRTEDGKKIRRAFVPAPGCIFVSADYSQIELRILAHFSRDKVLVDAFKNGRDIHTHTAREIFNVSADEVTAEMRRVAKVINFGIIYGMSAHGLVKELKISYQEAQAYIDNYFSQYPDV
ncbi:MAG: DNA polymerase I, partial [Planctomycetes bacterium]|nr:DNA polymerase I [Planctomycetota bacterium]